MSNFQLNKLKSGIKYGTEVALNLLWNIIGDHETIFSHKLLLTNKQISKIRTALGNDSTVNIKFLKIELS